MQSRRRNEAPTLTFCDYTCVCCGGHGVATDGVGGRGTLDGGHLDHSCPNGQVSSRVSLRINKGALVKGERNPSPTTLGPEGDLLAYVTNKTKQNKTSRN